MSGKYTYLFPYEKVPKGSRIIIYGAGDVGQEYLQQMELTGYCEVIAFVDKAHDKYAPMIVPIYSVEKLKRLSFDYVVLAFKMGAHVRTVTKKLVELGVDNERIVYIESRRDVELFVSETGDTNSGQCDFAYNRPGISISLKYGPGLGDAIVKKKIFMEIVSMEPNCHIDIYCPGISQVIHSFYSDQKNLNAVFDDGGALYASQQKKYDLSLTLSFMMEVDSFNYERVKEHNIEFAEKLKQLQEACSNYHLTGVGVIQRYVHFHRMKFLGLDYYTYPNYTGVFNIKDHQVTIPLDVSYEDQVRRLALPEKYVTINYGGGVASNCTNNEIAKEWPFSYLERFVKLFKEKYPQVGVIQLGSEGTPKVNGVDACFLGENLELVKYIIRDSLVHIDKEGGLVHLATQLGTKCIVCFGPTQEEFFGYPENINLKAGNCHGCHCLYDGFDVCARGLEKPECMWSITPEMVMEKVETLEEMKLSACAEKVLLAFYRFQVESICGIDNTQINNETMGMSPTQFKETLKELAGGNIYKKYFINSDTDREIGTSANNKCVSPGYNSRICDDGIKYIENNYEITDKNNETTIRHLSERINKINI